MEKIVLVESRQKNVMVRVNNNKYRFDQKPIEMKEEDAERLICGKLVDGKHIKGNNRFKIVSKASKDYDPELDFNKDGKNDSRDASLGAKAMARQRKEKRKVN